MCRQKPIVDLGSTAKIRQLKNLIIKNKYTQKMKLNKNKLTPYIFSYKTV